MDARVNDFLEEINEIVPPCMKQNKCAWKECFDENTGYPYYWNQETNVVTWEIPEEYRIWLLENESNQSGISVLPEEKPSVKPIFPSVMHSENNESKSINRKSTTSKSIQFTQKDQQVVLNNQEKNISLVTDYGSNNSDSENDTCCLPLKDLAKPSLIITKSKNSSNASSDNEDAQIKPTFGFKLLASYGNEDTDSEDEPISTEIHPENGQSHSTLFPNCEQVDISQFPEVTDEKSVHENGNNEHDIEINSKAFKRKRRIGVQLINQPRAKGVNGNNNGAENIKETGFVEESNNTESEGSKELPKFVAFIKSGDSLNAATENSPENKAENKEAAPKSDVQSESNEETRTMLTEKLNFLSEGREAPTSVQILAIQLEALYTALSEGGLDVSYFTKWLADMCSQIVQLEEESAPKGWNLEWDRTQKRYYYRNKVSDECQWDYPQQQEDQDEEEEEDDPMDICTTPPQVGSPTRRPEAINNNQNSNDSNMVEVTKNEDSDFKSVLDSFYSDIGAIEKANMGNSEEASSENISVFENNVEPPAKKKKKVKVSQGTSMKKKGVSKLVEKWKNVQKDLV